MGSREVTARAAAVVSAPSGQATLESGRGRRSQSCHVGRHEPRLPGQSPASGLFPLAGEGTLPPEEGHVAS